MDLRKQIETWIDDHFGGLPYHSAMTVFEKLWPVIQATEPPPPGTTVYVYLKQIDEAVSKLKKEFYEQRGESKGASSALEGTGASEERK